MVFERIRAKPPLSAAVVMMGVAALGLSRDRPPALVVAPEAAVEPPPCIDETVELVGDGENAVLCWPGGTCWSNGARVSHPPAVHATEPVTIVGPTHVCTGGRCDELGPKVQRHLRYAHDIQVTRDHAVLVLDGFAWNRVRDASIPLPADADVEVLGDRMMVTTSGNGTLLVDADGNQHGWAFSSYRDDTTMRARQDALAGDRFLVFGRVGDITLIDGGTPMYTGLHRVYPTTVVLSPDRVGYLACDAMYSCWLGHYEISKHDVTEHDDMFIPRCSQSASSAATSAASGETSSIP